MIFYSLKNKLIVTIATVIFILGILATYTVFLYSKNIFFENEKEALSAIATEQAQQISIILKNSTDLSKLISQQDFVINYLNNSEKTHQNIEVLNRFKSYNINDEYSSIYLLDSEGTTLVSTAESFVSKNYSFRDYFKKALSGENFTDISMGVTSKELGYYFSSPVKNINNQIIGVMVLKMKPDKIDALINKSDHQDIINNYELLAIIDDYSVIFHSSDESKLFKSVAELNPETLSEITTKKRFSDYELASLDYDIALDKIKTSEKPLNLKVIDKTENNNLLINIAKIKDYPFCVIIIENENALISNALNISYTLGIFIILAIILAVIIVNIIISRFTKPLSELNTVVTKATQGDLSQRTIKSSDDELGILSKNFNNLIGKLEKNLAEVEKKVEERTGQLEKTNQAMAGRELKMIELKKELNDLKKKG
ncbi:MAG: HAMP domain-containing protein [Candidatus Pacebacteria bacterium]|nr:HAMP domain-containing protein [Candidatus Paceibacterota bacterium]